MILSNTELKTNSSWYLKETFVINLHFDYPKLKEFLLLKIMKLFISLWFQNIFYKI